MTAVKDKAPRVRIDPTAVQWRDAATGRAGSHLLVVMHGYASYEDDLIALAPGLPDNVTIASLRAPYTLRAASERVQGAYAWFQLMPEADHRQPIDAAVAAVLEWLDGLAGDWASVGLLGFSQGCVMTMQLARTAPERFNYLVGLSGFLFPGGHPGDTALAARSPRIPAFQAIGTADPIIDTARTAALTEWMRQHTALESHEYPMAHQVVPQEVADIASFIGRQLA